MKLSVENFKSIKILEEFEIKPLTILSGVNSAGKSSFIQLLLLLKETLKANTPNHQLVLDGELFSVAAFKDILHDHLDENKLKIEFIVNRNDFLDLEAIKNIGVLNALGDYECRITIKYDVNDDKPFISDFSVIFDFEDKDNKERYLKVTQDGNEKVSIDTNIAIFGLKLQEDKPLISSVSYTSIYPTYYEWINRTSGESQGKSGEEPAVYKEVIDLDGFKELIDKFFRDVSYIGPVREIPQDVYTIAKTPDNVGMSGEFVARVLEERADDTFTFKGIEKHDTGVEYVEMSMKLSEAVKYWMCDIFDLAADIYAEKKEDNYKIILKRKSGLETSIKHVGFGISQLLPVVVEGLIMPNGGTLILEQPEIHLHPKLQSSLYDFIFGLAMHGKTVIVETHSSHFITRMRRRIAEDPTNTMHDNISLTFIEDELFKTIDLDDYGTLNYYPQDFIETSNEELSAIVQAQMNKRISD